MRLWSMGRSQHVHTRVIGRLASQPVLHSEEQRNTIAYGSNAQLAAFGSDLKAYAGVLCTDQLHLERRFPVPSVYAPPHLEYLDSGDVVMLNPSGMVNVLYRHSSPVNTILMTERCNSFCLMCSQPPKLEDDSYRVGVILRLLDLVDPGALELILSKADRLLPRTAIHVLTNGRRFKDASFANRVAGIHHHDLMLGIPLYSDIDTRHDYVVQAQGAFEETLQGFYNLARAGVRVELRVVIHKQTYERLPRLADFIARNLPFVEHVALMGLEMFGFTPRNLPDLWIDPADYQSQLEDATLYLAMRGMTVSIYNHQLCTLPRTLWPFARKSISDWKNVYLDECTACGVRSFCGGFFQSATKKHSAHIAPQATLAGGDLRFMQELHGAPSAEGAATRDA